MNDAQIVGDAFIFANNTPVVITVYVRQRVHQQIPIDPVRDRSWPEFVEKVARPALAAAGWEFDAWHRPRVSPDIFATAVVWRWR